MSRAKSSSSASSSPEPARRASAMLGHSLGPSPPRPSCDAVRIAEGGGSPYRDAQSFEHGQRVAAQARSERTSMGNDKKLAKKPRSVADDLRPSRFRARCSAERGQRPGGCARRRRAPVVRPQIRLLRGGVVHVTFVGPHEAARHIERGGLAGAVRSDETDDLSEETSKETSSSARSPSKWTETCSSARSDNSVPGDIALDVTCCDEG